MFTSTFELITLAASNSHILFCFCNLIIAILLIGTKPVFSNFHRQATIPPPATGNQGSHNVVDYNEKGTLIGVPVAQSVTVDDIDQDHETADHIDESDDKPSVTIHDKEEEEEEEVEEGEDELRRRVEEFIDKINKAWKAEKLGHIPFSST